METVRDADLNGHPRPAHCTFTADPGGASTLSRLIRAPRRETRPAIRTTGKGLIRLNARTADPAALTTMGSEAASLALVET